jgi:hypothetical protein
MTGNLCGKVESGFPAILSRCVLVFASLTFSRDISETHDIRLRSRSALQILIFPSLLLRKHSHEHASSDPFARSNSTAFLHLKSRCTGKEHREWRLCRSPLERWRGDHVYRAASCWLPRLPVSAGYLRELLRLDRRRFHRHQVIRT